jgi:hypothetical protein
MMSSSIGSGTDALQMLRAQQAFSARPAETARPAQAEVGADESAGDETELATSGTLAAPQNKALYQEVQDLASRLGYVGLSEKAIERAMVLGESLLADYRA